MLLLLSFLGSPVLHVHVVTHVLLTLPRPQGVSALVPSWVVRYWPILGRLAVTLGMLAIIRAGYFIPVPGVDMARLPAAVGGLEGEPANRGQQASNTAQHSTAHCSCFAM